MRNNVNIFFVDFSFKPKLNIFEMLLSKHKERKIVKERKGGRIQLFIFLFYGFSFIARVNQFSVDHITLPFIR